MNSKQLNSYKHFLAFDIGATSGRCMVGSFINNVFLLKELTRFPNPTLKIGGHYHWNIFTLYEHILAGIKAASNENIVISSIGIDTWGVDFAFVGEDGSVLGLPYAYRDPHTYNMPEKFFRDIMSRNKVYSLTGIQVMNFNSLYQLYTLKCNHSSQLAASSKLLFMPDALSYMLTGEMVMEYTIASTSQLINPRTRNISKEILNSFDLNVDLFARIVMPCEKIGMLHEDIANECGVVQIPVIAVAGHDTASAVASIPANNENFAYLSSGTWSLMGIEIDEPIISERTLRLNITNEGGVDGTTRLLKNITGMWILEQCIKEWTKRGKDYSYTQIANMASGVENDSYIDPDHSSFANPKSMLKAIDEYCDTTNQRIPQNDAEYMRLIFESLASKYKYILEYFKELAPFHIERLYIIGGGSQNELLNQMTADSIAMEVLAGPKEATAIGNIMLQAKANGVIDSISEMRKLILETIEVKKYQPIKIDLWKNKYEKFLKIIK